MATLEVTEEQLSVIQSALDLYSRVGVGQFDRIVEHTTFENYLYKKFNKDFTYINLIEDKAKDLLHQARDILYQDNSIGQNGSWGIYSENVDESCRIAFDLQQVIRHEKWKRKPDRTNLTIDSSVHLTTKNSDKIKVEL